MDEYPDWDGGLWAKQDTPIEKKEFRSRGSFYFTPYSVQNCRETVECFTRSGMKDSHCLNQALLIQYNFSLILNIYHVLSHIGTSALMDLSC